MPEAVEVNDQVEVKLLAALELNLLQFLGPWGYL